MSKYITHFQTEAAYQSALPSLDLPNVSLVDELGEVHYHRALYGAHAGDICLYDVAEGQKIFVTAENWNLTDYPTASYPIVGIAIADENPTGVTLCSALGMAEDGSTSTTDVKLKWQNEYFDWGLTKYRLDSALNDLNGKTNTATIIAAIKAYDLSHSTDNLTGNASGAIQTFAVTGTSAGDWYIGAGGEVNTMLRSTELLNSLNKIKTADSNLASLIDTRHYNTSTEYNISNDIVIFPTSPYTVTYNYKNSDYYVRPFLRL